jgi:drug/metabolite transporter (DMT)-like permease
LSRRTFAEAALVGVAAVWGLTFVMVQDAIERLTPFAFLAYRFIPAALIVGALVAVQLGACGLFCLGAAVGGDLEAPRGGTVWSALIVTSLLASAVGFLVQSYAQQHAPPARTALILAAEPAFAGLFGYLLQDERLSAVAWTGALLILAAIVLVDVVPRLRPPRPLPEG